MALIVTSSRKSARVESVNDENDADKQPKRTRIDDVGVDEMDRIIEYMKKNRTPTVTHGEMLDIVLMQGKVRHDFYTMKMKTAAGRKSTKHNATEKVAAYLRCSKDLAGKV